MRTNRPLHLALLRLLILLPLCAAPALAAPPQGSFQLTSVNVVNGDNAWRLNRAVELQFNEALDFATVNFNTVRLTTVGGSVVVGDFGQVDATTLRFQPRCYTQPDFSDGGFVPNESYILDVPDTSDLVPTLRSVTGRRLEVGTTVGFSTPNSTDPAVLFLDVEPGGPRPVIRPQGSMEERATYAELGGDPQARQYFEPDANGTGMLAPGFLAPNNLYSRPETAVELHVFFNQPITPTQANLAHLWIEYLDPGGAWVRMQSASYLASNCDTNRSEVVLRPLGILAQGSLIRAVAGADFSDIVGQPIGAPRGRFAVFRTATFEDATMSPTDFSDVRLEEYEGPVRDADTEDPFALPARVGGGALTPSFDFAGTGGPGGNFDWVIPAGQTIVLDTTVAIIVGGPGGVPTTTQTVIGGVINLRDMTVMAGGRLVFQGPNQVKILATGTVRIEGEVRLDGLSNPGVVTLNSNFTPEIGAPGTAGGGRGGVGSPLTTASSPGGLPGFGPFDVAGLGGQGGESAYGVGSVNDRRPGGGGGGRFADFAPISTQPAIRHCPDQSSLGLDGERGFDGSPLGTGAITGLMPAQGGAAGSGPFADMTRRNDFWGRAVQDFESGPQLLIGELPGLWAGYGGGAGGDAYNSSTFPTNPYNPFADDKGAGGAGGGGGIEICALGPIVFAGDCLLSANGGLGGGGENTAGLNRVGGGSGGGSGGHIVLQSLTAIDLSALNMSNGPFITAFGGQGGAGKNEQGGAKAGGIATAPHFDGIHSDVANCPNPPLFVDIECAGGDGGPGVIQFHVPVLANDGQTGVVMPGMSASAGLRFLVNPVPAGYQPVLSQPQQWLDQLLPAFGSRSEAVSEWIPLGGVHVNPSTVVPDPLAFQLDGTDPNDASYPGRVNATGGVVDELAALLGPVLLSAPPTTPYIDFDGRTMVMDAAPLAAFELKQNPNLMQGYALKLADSSAPATFARFTIAAASYDDFADELRVTTSSNEPPLTSFGAASIDVSLHPRFLGVSTAGVMDDLPAATAIQIRFQAAPADAEGDPDEAAIFPATGVWAASVADLNSAPGNTGFVFYRVRVNFDLGAGGGPVNPFMPRPSLEFLGPPFRF